MDVYTCFKCFSNIYWQSGTIKTDNVYKRHAAFGKRYELLMTSIAVMKKQKLKNH